ncbi:MAG: hemolysin III family protein, partial [Clostridia bacterium]
MAKKDVEVRTSYDAIRPYSALTHYIGVLMAVSGFVLLEVFAVWFGSVRHVVCFAIYGASLVALYTASTFYHIVPLAERGRSVLRVMDHMMIYILIAGTYTPICLIALRGALGWSIFGVIWSLTIAGLVITVFFKNTPRAVSAIIYIVMGWIVVGAFWPLSQKI